MAEEEKLQEEKTTILTGFNRVLEILANKISRKAALLALAMVLTYLLAVTPTVTELLTVVGVICGLAIFGVMLQFIIDYINAGNKKKALEKKEEKDQKDPG
jgi:hypothetical protein